MLQLVRLGQAIQADSAGLLMRAESAEFEAAELWILTEQIHGYLDDASSLQVTYIDNAESE